MDDVRFRYAGVEDKGFILKNWIRNFVRSPYAGPYTKPKLIDALIATIKDLRKRGAKWVVAYSGEHPEVLYGFVCYEEGYPWPLLHYVFVKGRYRDGGIGAALVQIAQGESEKKLRYTFETATKPRRRPRLLRNGVHRPNLARSPKRKDKDDQN